MTEKEKKRQKEKDLYQLIQKEQKLVDEEYDLRAAQAHLEDEEQSADWAFSQLCNSLDNIHYRYRFEGQPAQRYQYVYQERERMRMLFEESRQDLNKDKRKNQDNQDEVYAKRLHLQREIEEMD